MAEETLSPDIVALITRHVSSIGHAKSRRPGALDRSLAAEFRKSDAANPGKLFLADAFSWELRIADAACTDASAPHTPTAK